MPVSINGYYNSPTGAPCNPTNLTGCTVNSYPLNGFTAYATSYSAAPPTCDGSSGSASCGASTDSSGVTTPIAGGANYWRVCLSVSTEEGVVTPNNASSGSAATTGAWGQLVGVVMAVTRCVPNNGNTGSGFTVWSN